MAWVRFTADYWERLHLRQERHFKPGMRFNLRHHIAEEVIAAGKAEAIPAPTRDEAKEWLQANSRTG